MGPPLQRRGWMPAYAHSFPCPLVSPACAPGHEQHLAVRLPAQHATAGDTDRGMHAGGERGELDAPAAPNGTRAPAADGHAANGADRPPGPQPIRVCTSTLELPWSQCPLRPARPWVSCM